jgi:hypothetical protein
MDMMKKDNIWPAEKLNSRRKMSRFIVILAALTAMLLLAGGPVFAKSKKGKANSCTQTAQSAFLACQHDAKASYWIEEGTCENLSDQDEREECQQDAKETYAEDKATCPEQREARREICDELGRGPYDPEIDPAMFVDPSEIGTTISPNPYFPLLNGRKWIYTAVADGETETVTVEVTADIKELLGVKCVVVRDTSVINGVLHEDTKDWYAQDVDGNVWYFGEISQGFEDGDLATLEGSWTAGVDYAKPGIIMSAYPEVGELYRQEFDLGNAEDMAEVLSTTGTESTATESCSGDCLITKDFSPIEPDVVEHKYFKPGVGQILTIDLETGTREELTGYTP